MKRDRIRIAVTGTGFGTRIQVPGFRLSGRFDVVALVGRDRERTARIAAEHGIPHAFASLGDALVAVDVDAVSVAAPPAAHAEHVLAALAGRKHVMCEKPMARSLAEAEAMEAAARAAGVVALIDHELRFHPSRAGLARLIASGDIGAPHLLVAFDDLPLYVTPYRSAPAWWFDADAGGGWLGASGSHLIDAVRVWLGDVRRVVGVVERLAAPGTADDTFSLIADTRSGARAVLHQSAAMIGPRSGSLRIAGSEGTAWLDEDWRLWMVRRRTDADDGSAGAPGDPALVPPDADLALPEVDIPRGSGPFAARELPCFVRQALAFADAIEGRPASGPAAATFADGVAVQRVMDAARTGRWMAV
ncbi:MAG TPA: Gfo/Idh/MocA family oxidoreductase [Candidatus Binatia bacterium]|nr:Gfo/Idh/MocA family oxidoreductase [Candidatus Binatia bacterium]